MTRLTILDDNEQIEFDAPPTLSAETKALAFAIDKPLSQQLKKLRGATNKVGFLLQYAYFKASRRFFTIKKFRLEDIDYASKLLNIPHYRVDLGNYKNTTPKKHRGKILTLFNCKSFQQEKNWVEKEIALKVQQVIEPKAIFFDVLHQLHHHNIEIPSYNTLAELISHYYYDHEKRSLDTIDSHLKDNQKIVLDALLVTKNHQHQTTLSRYKVINQSLQPKTIHNSIKTFRSLSELTIPLRPLINALSLTPQSSEYYATWVKKAKLSQLKQFNDDRKRYLYLAAFLQHQYYMRQDNFVDIFLRSVRTAINAAISKLRENDGLTRFKRRKAIKHVTTSNKNYRSLIDAITEVTHSTVLTDSGKVNRIAELLSEHENKQDAKEKKKTVMLEQSLDNLAKDKDYFDHLEKLSRKLQARVAEILKVLVFNEDNSCPTLLKAIQHYKQKDGNINASAPQDFLNDDEREALIDNHNNFRVSLYKILLFMAVADNIKSGKLNLIYSYRYLAIQEYLVDTATWNNERDELLTLAKLNQFSDPETVLNELKEMLDDKYHTVNHRILNNLNPHFTISAEDRGALHIKTPALDEKETKHISAFLNQVGYIPILQVLTEVDKVAQFTGAFTHHSVKHTKSKPSSQLFYAGIIGLGCNIGVTKMAQISSGINQNTMSNTINWFFSLKNISAANESIRAFINQLALPHIFANSKNKRHSSSDGRKVGVAVESLLATYSFKYFGKDKGVSIYTFIDDRQVLFHHNVMSASEREAAYVLDGLNNINSPKIDIHSTDTHGYTELIFGATHLFETTFAPRIKNISSQKIYSFHSKKYYQNRGYQIIPSRPIRQHLIINHWEDILRFIATIKLNKASASQLFKRLSSYAKDNPLYKALKEFGRIIKSLFILTYYDDVQLRQRIEKQLNRVESSNKFAKAIFYANNSEFRQAEQHEQNIAVACKVLIQNSIVLWNYLYLSQLLTNCSNEKERNEMISLIKEGSVLSWAHVNLHGEFDFKRKAANESFFDIAKILSLNINNLS